LTLSVALLTLVLGAAACGDDSTPSSTTADRGSSKQDGGGSATTDNYQACKDWLATVKCGSYDPSTAVPCDGYKQITTCSIASYFQCLTDNFKCTGGVPDASGWVQCQSKATCK